MTTRPNGLTALCILSWIWMAIFTYDLVTKLANGPITDEQIREQKLVLLEAYNAEDPQLMETSGWVIEDTLGMMKASQENNSLLNGIEGIQLLIGIVGVFFMFRLRKIGFHLYIIYSLISIFYWPYFFGEFSIGFTLSVLSGIFAALFVTLYAFQVKHMNQ